MGRPKPIKSVVLLLMLTLMAWGIQEKFAVSESVMARLSSFYYYYYGDGNQDGDYTYTITDGTAQITGYTGPGGIVVIPGKLGELPVTSICDWAFWNHIGLISITIPQGVTSIGEGAFSTCTGLTGIGIPESVTSIGNYAFYSCEFLTNISIPVSVTNIGASTFRGCVGLTSIAIPEGVASIGEGAFSGCTGLSSITIPKSVMSIGDDAFSWCRGLTAINVAGENQNYISVDGVLFNREENILVACPGGLISITIPQGVTGIGDCAFSGCGGLTNISIPDSVTSIGNGAFCGCEGLTSIIIPESVTSIGDSAFCYCTGLTSISMPQGITSIGYGTFSGCESLSSITFDSATTEIYDDENTIPAATKIIGYDPSTAKNYATKYNRTFEVIGTTNTLQSIAITTPAIKLSYAVDEPLDITGLVVTGTYSDNSNKIESITTANITGFNSASAATDQVLTITIEGKTTTYLVTINAPTSYQPAFNINTIPNNTLKLGDDFFDMSSDAMNDPQATIMIASLLKDGINKNIAYFKFGGKWYAPFELTEEQFLDPAYALTDVQVNGIRGFNKWYKAGSEIVDLRPGTYTITPINEFSSGFAITANNVPEAAYFNVYKKSNSTLVNAVPIAIGSSLNSMPAVFSSISDLEVWIYSDAAGTDKIVELQLEGSSTAGILDYE